MCWGCSKTRPAGLSAVLHSSVEMPRVLSVSRPMSNTEILRTHCRSCKRTGYMHNIPDSTHDRSETLTSPLTLACRGLFPRCVKRTGHEAGRSPPTTADVKNELRSTSTSPPPPYFFMAWYLIRYMDRPDDTACKQALQKMTQYA